MIYSYGKITHTHTSTVKKETGQARERARKTLFEYMLRTKFAGTSPAHLHAKMKAVNYMHSNDARVSYMKGQWMDRAIMQCTQNRIKRKIEENNITSTSNNNKNSQRKRKEWGDSLVVGFSSFLQIFLIFFPVPPFIFFPFRLFFECVYSCLIARNFRGF